MFKHKWADVWPTGPAWLSDVGTIHIDFFSNLNLKGTCDLFSQSPNNYKNYASYSQPQSRNGYDKQYVFLVIIIFQGESQKDLQEAFDSLLLDNGVAK